MTSFRETVDAEAADATTYRVRVGDSFSGSLTAGDVDWIKISLTAGKAYQFDTRGDIDWSRAELLDSYGSVIDRGAVPHSAITTSSFSFVAPATDTYYIRIGGNGDVGSGHYKVAVKAVIPPKFASYDTIAKQLATSYWIKDDRHPSSFDVKAGEILTVNMGKLTADGKQLAKWGLDAWTDASGIQFQLVTGKAQITFDDKETVRPVTNSFSSPVGTTDSASVNVAISYIKEYGTAHNTYSLATYIHEIGHALGLGHPGDYNNYATWGKDELFGNDSKQLTVMSYFNVGDNPWSTASSGPAITPMMADILAIRKLYGITAINAGNTNHTLKAYFADDKDGKAMMTLVDTGGKDTLDASWATNDQRIDLHPESFSNIGGGLNNFSLARGTVIENAIGGKGRDFLFGNSSANVLEGRAGNDTLLGGTGSDKLIGGRGSDTFVFAKGDGKDIVLDFSVADGDRLDLDFGGSADTFQEAVAQARQSGSNTVFDFGHGDKITLKDVQLASLTVDQVHFHTAGLV